MNNNNNKLKPSTTGQANTITKHDLPIQCNVAAPMPGELFQCQDLDIVSCLLKMKHMLVVTLLLLVDYKQQQLHGVQECILVYRILSLSRSPEIAWDLTMQLCVCVGCLHGFWWLGSEQWFANKSKVQYSKMQSCGVRVPNRSRLLAWNGWKMFRREEPKSEDTSSSM